MVLKNTNGRKKCSGSTAAAVVWHRLTTGESEAGLMADYAIAARRLWGLCVRVVCQLVKTPAGLLLLSFGCHLALLRGLDDLACKHLSLWMVKVYSLAAGAGCCGC